MRFRSGAMHYFRIHPDDWKDRLRKLKQCGLNTVETYIAWNFHEEEEGEFNFPAGAIWNVLYALPDRWG
ncbi:MAG: beta-galactosidase [Lentisphaeria bacterium]|nr:MAG: beta-galactosidase [Lentisphaeria bacterium]